MAVLNDKKRYADEDIYKDDFPENEDEYEIDAPDYFDDDDDVDENALWDDENTADTDTEDSPEKKRRKRKEKLSFADTDMDAEDIDLSEQTQRQIAKEQQLIDEIEADASENPIEEDEEETDEQPGRKLLKRELKALALKRLEDSARTVEDYGNIVAWYDKLDANRERRERYHELSRSGDDLPIDYGTAEDGLYFPDTLNDVIEKQIRKGDFIDAIFYCPYDIHELVADADMSNILQELSEDHKLLLFLWALRQYSSTRIAEIRRQSDRNIRKVRNTMLKKIRKKLLAALTTKVQTKQPLTLLEKMFLEESGVSIEKVDKK